MKDKRQKKILELIKSKIFLTQEELRDELLALGYNVTQSTVSRDIKELRIVKGHDSRGNYRYIADSSSSSASPDTGHYMASSACVAVDELFGDMMLGSLAGDDTIIIVTAGEPQSAGLAGELNKLLK